MQEENKPVFSCLLSLFFKEQEWTKNIFPFSVQKPILPFASRLVFLQAEQSILIDNEPIVTIFIAC